MMRARGCFLTALFVVGAALAPQVTFADTFVEYALTVESYAYDVDMDVAVVSEYGEGAEVADWVALAANFSGEIAAFCDAVGLPAYGDHAWVYLSGSGFYSSSRHYFVERHDGSVPGGWLVHDQIDDHTLCLGSWSGEKRILVRLPSASPVCESTWSGIKAMFAH